MKLLFTAGLLLLASMARAQAPPGPPTRTARNQLLLLGGGVAGRVPGAFRYAAAGLGLARTSQWRYPNAEYDSDFTMGLRLSLGRQQPRPGASPTQSGWGLNPYAASDGRFFGLSLGVWLGRLGDFRAEGTRLARIVPQVRARAGQLGSWHGLLSYADHFTGLGNPPVLLGGGYGGLWRQRLTLRAGAAVPTLAPMGQEVQLYTEAGLRLGQEGTVACLVQPALSAAASGQVHLYVVWPL
ncbi:hypothetical protein [Hymenobacter weizhouensis]|uniref:hypothetical protein n=1 Tax=Hymenobacter sp. YIM 151500-1 TaxID=2987689 RepID=UPI0022278961|nr:hypothetical protein [Hymenobacter sp. YIM 151500-1]UYZ64713.1 hypothetical protein OIS53_07650 [Hymenobacter sp. YIM 151500-1]